MRDHKSLLAWQRAHVAAAGVLRLCKRSWRPEASAVFAQLQRSSLSVQLNIAEGHALRSASRFGYHLTIAYGSAVETIELLELGLEENLFPANVGRPILEASIEARGYLLGLMKRYRRGSHGRG